MALEESKRNSQMRQAEIRQSIKDKVQSIDAYKYISKKKVDC